MNGACYDCDIRSTELTCFLCGEPMTPLQMPSMRSPYSDEFIRRATARRLGTPSVSVLTLDGEAGQGGSA